MCIWNPSYSLCMYMPIYVFTYLKNAKERNYFNWIHSDCFGYAYDRRFKLIIWILKIASFHFSGIMYNWIFIWHDFNTCTSWNVGVHWGEWRTSKFVWYRVCWKFNIRPIYFILIFWRSCRSYSFFFTNW